MIIIPGGAIDLDGTGANNYVATFTGPTTIQGEANLTFDSSTLTVTGDATVTGDLTLSAGADGALRFTNAGENSIKIPDNQASALIIEEADNAYITFVTTNSSEAITVAKATTFSAGIANSGTIAAGTWNGTAIASAYLDADTAHLSTTQTFSGAKTFSADVTITGTTPLLTIGDNADEDTGLIFAGHDGSSNVDYHMGFDAGDNAFVIGTGTTIGAGGTRALAILDGNIVVGHPNEVSPLNYVQFLTRGDWTSGGGYNYAASMAVGSDMTGHADDVNFLTHFGAGTSTGGSITMGANAAVVSTMHLSHPAITTGGNTPAIASTLYILNAPGEGTVNYALHVAEGVSRFDGGVIFNEDSASVDFRVESNGLTHALFVDGSADSVGIGTDTPLSRLHVVDDGNAMRFHEHGSSDVAEFKLVGAADHDVALYFGDANDEVEAGFYWDTSAAMLKFNGHNNSTRMVIDPNGNLLINSTTVPTETGSTLSHGILIDQGADDGDAFQIRNSDVGHDVTDVKATDVFFAIRKAGGTSGGAMLEGFRDADQDAGFAFLVRGTLAEAADTSESAGESCLGVVQMDAAVKSTNARGAVAADGNAFLVSNNLTAEFIVKGDGELYSNQSATVATFDSYDDAQLIRTLDHARKPSTMINDKWDEFIKYNEQDLIDARILGDTVENGGMINITGLQRLHNGAIWQGYTRQMALQEEVNELKTRLLALEGGK